MNPHRRSLRGEESLFGITRASDGWKGSLTAGNRSAYKGRITFVMLVLRLMRRA
jgi:hypothetical protein